MPAHPHPHPHPRARVDTGLTIRIPLGTEYAPYRPANDVDAEVLAWLGQAAPQPAPVRRGLARLAAHLTAWRTR